MQQLWGTRVYRHRRVILAATALAMVAAAAILNRGGHLSIGAFDDAESMHAEELIRTLQRPGESSFVAIFGSETMTVDAPEFTQALRQAVAAIAKSPHVVSVISPVDAPGMAAQRFYSADAHHALVAVTLDGDLAIAAKHYPEVRALVPAQPLQSKFTGKIVLMHDIEIGLHDDLIRAELVAAPISLLLLFLVFRSIVAALLPVVVGGLAVAAGVASVFLLSHVTDVPNYAINICSLIGLGVAIDYSLFIVSRYRAELDAGHSIEAALGIALQTAGRSVVFSGLTVAIGLAGLLFFHGSFLAALGIAGALVVGFAVLAALTTLPALLAVLGRNIDRGSLRRSRSVASSGRWRRFALTVTRRPWLVLLPSMLVVALAAWPFSRLRVATTDVTVLPHDAEARVGFDALQTLFPDTAATRITVVAEFPSTPALDVQRVRALYQASHRIAKLPHVRTIESIVDLNPSLPPANYELLVTWPAPLQSPEIQYAFRALVAERAALLTIVTDVPPSSPEARSLVADIRAHREVADGSLWVGGQTARDLDSQALIGERTPYAITFIVTMTAIILFALLRSVLLPIKAVVMNLLSIGASFGALVWVFQEGHGRTLLSFEPGFIDPTLPVMLFCIVFGLSMDYEVLLLHRMQEEYERTGNNAEAVALGLEQTSGLITSAAAIMVSVFAAFAMARILVIKATGVGIVVAVVMDATLVRLLIVPSTMQLLGDLNWWAPRIFARKPSANAVTDSMRPAD